MSSKARKNPPVRDPSETTLTVSLPVTLKQSLNDRGEATERPVSQLVRWAVEYQDRVGWKDIHLARIPE